MKKFFSLMALVIFTSTMLFMACGDDDETETSSYTIEVENPTMTGSNIDVIMDYMNAVSKAYQQSVGITNGTNMLLEGTVSANASSLKSKFEATTLPTNAPDASIYTYSFTIVLAGYDSAGRTTIASRTFSNN